MGYIVSITCYISYAPSGVNLPLVENFLETFFLRLSGNVMLALKCFEAYAEHYQRYLKCNSLICLRMK